MFIRHFSRAILVCLAAASAGFAQNQGQDFLFLFTPQPNTFTQFSAYNAGGSSMTAFSPGTGPAGIAAIIPTVDGTGFFLLGTGGATAAESADATITNFHTINGLGGVPTAGVPTPDGRYFLIGADRGQNQGELDIIDLSNYNDVTPGGIPLAGTPNFASIEQPDYCASCWIAVSRDSQYAFILTNSPLGSQVTAINIATKQKVGLQLNLTGDATSISLSPTGQLYVAATNVIYYFNPSLLTGATTGVAPETCIQVNLNQTVPLCNQIGVYADPNKLHFDPQGQYIYFANRTGGTAGQSLFQINLQTGAVNTWPNQGSGIVGPRFSDILVASNGRMFAFAPSLNTLFDVTASPFVATLDAPSLGLPRVTIENVTAAGISGEMPMAHWLYLLVANGNQTNLYRMDLTTNAISQQVLSSFSAGVMQVYTVPTQTGAAQFINYNDGQHVANGATTLPLVARVLDSSGIPVYNAPATFTADSASGLIVNSPTSSTNANGLVQTTVTVPAGGGICGQGVCTITLNAGGATDTFTVNIPFTNTGGGGGGGTGGGGGGGTGGGGTAQMILYSGDGQLLESGFPVNQAPLTVQVLDANGKPISGVTVNFNVTAGPATVDTNTATTDANGFAQANLRPVALTATPPGFFASTITATSTYGTVNFTATIFTTTALGGTDVPQTIVVNPQDNAPVQVTAGSVTQNGIVVQVYSQSNQCQGCPIPGVGLALRDPSNLLGDPTLPQSPVACQGSSLSDSNGTAHCNVVATTCKTGNFQIAIMVGGFQEHDLGVVIAPGPLGASAAIISGNGQNGSPGQQLATPLVAQVLDACGNPAPGAVVTWTVTPASSVTLKNTVTTADNTGKVSTSLIFGNTPGSITVTLTLASGATVKYTLTNKISVASLSLVSGGNQTAVTGQAFAQPIVVVAKDASGNPVQGSTINFAVTSGSATISPASLATNASGQAQATVTAGTGTGNVVVSATFASLSVTANLTVVPPGPSITASSFTNTASGAVGLVPCSLANVTGAGVAPNLQGVVSSSLFGPLNYALGPISSLTVNGVPAPISSVASLGNTQQVTFQVPCEVSPGSATVVLSTSGAPPATITGVQVLPAQPGLFTYNGPNNKVYAAVIRGSNGTYVTPSNFATRGETLYAVVTGLGQTTPAALTDNPGTGQAVNGTVIVGVNNAGVPVGSATYLSGAIGVYIIPFTIPTSGPVSSTGTDLPFQIAVLAANGQVYYSNSVYLPGVN